MRAGRNGKALLRERPNLNLLVVGDGPYMPDMRRRSRGIGGVVFTGELPAEDLIKIYSGSDLLIFPGTTDSCGTVVAEAQACGLPAIVSDRGGLQKLIQDGKSGFVVPNLSVLDWKDEIDFVLRIKAENPARFHSLGEAGRKLALTREDRSLEEDRLSGPP
jgi:glycosyltransferase involved in cell wall biosynthesis